MYISVVLVTIEQKKRSVLEWCIIITWILCVSETDILFCSILYCTEKCEIPKRKTKLNRGIPAQFFFLPKQTKINKRT